LFINTFLVASGVFMANMITPNFICSEMDCRCGCGHDEMDGEFMLMDMIHLHPQSFSARSDSIFNASGNPVDLVVEETHLWLMIV
jgi:hypothetical protein